MYIIFAMKRIFLRVRSERDNELLYKFANRVRKRRMELDISQMELAETIGCHLNAIGRIERGEADPSLLMVLKIAKALKIHPKELIPEICELP